MDQAAQTERLFVAVWPGEQALAELDAMVRPAAAGVRWMPRENLHVTLLFLGRTRRDEVAEALGSARLVRCTAQLGTDAVPLGRDSLVLPVHGLDTLARAVREAVGHMVEHPDDRPFRGHVTVARLRRGAAAPAHVRLGAAIDVTVRDVHLVRSVTAHTGAAYSTVASFPTVSVVPG